MAEAGPFAATWSRGAPAADENDIAQDAHGHHLGERDDGDEEEADREDGGGGSIRSDLEPRRPRRGWTVETRRGRRVSRRSLGFALAATIRVYAASRQKPSQPGPEAGQHQPASHADAKDQLVAGERAEEFAHERELRHDRGHAQPGHRGQHKAARMVSRVSGVGHGL